MSLWGTCRVGDGAIGTDAHRYDIILCFYPIVITLASIGVGRDRSST